MHIIQECKKLYYINGPGLDFYEKVCHCALKSNFSAEKTPFGPGKSVFSPKSRLYSQKDTFSASILFKKNRPLTRNVTYNVLEYAKKI